MQKFPRHNKAIRQSAQTAVEYLLLLSVMVILALTAFRTMMPDVFFKTNGHVGNAISNMIGEVPRTGELGPFP